MWYLLVAAGAGYLATKWQNGQKLRLVCGQNGKTSPPSSPSATPKREFCPSLSNSMPTSPNVVDDPSSGFNSLRQKSSTIGFHILSDNDISSSPQEIKSNKRSACEAFLISPVQVEREDPLVFTSNCSLNAAASTDNKEELQLKEELSPSPSSCCSSNSTVINSPVDSHSILQRYDGSFKIQGKEQGSQPMQPSAVFHFQGKEQKMQSSILPNQTTNPPLNNKVERDSPRDVQRESPRDVSGMTTQSQYAEVERDIPIDVERESPRDVSDMTTQNQYAKVLQHAGFGGSEEKSLFDYTVAAQKLNVTALTSINAAAVTNNSMLLDAGIHTPLSFTGKRQRDDTRADTIPDDLICTHVSKSDAIQGTSQTVVQKNGSSLSPCRSIQSQKASDNRGDADGDAFVSFGLAMAVCFMVSSSKQEMEKMGKVLRETEDLVSDMRKDLEERKLHSCMGEEDSDEFFTIKIKDAVEQECMTGTVFDRIDTLCESGSRFCKDESMRSDVTEATIQNKLYMYDIEENFRTGSYCVETNGERSDIHMKRGTNNGKLQSAYCDSEGESDLDEAGDIDCTMSMIELERKLWQVFQERQEERILELEGALELALIELHAKEEELRWWKNRASWLMEQSFGSTSGEIFTKDRVKRIEGFECASVGNELQLLSHETSLSAVEGCMEVGVKDSYPSLTGRSSPLVRTSSTCSTNSGESVLSIDVRALTYPVNQYDGTSQPREDIAKVDF